MIQCERKLNGYRNNLKRKHRHIAQTRAKFSWKSVRNFLQTNNKVHTKGKKSGYWFSVFRWIFFVVFFFFFTFRLGLSLISEMTTPYTHTNLHVRLIWWNWMGLLKWINFTCFHGPALFSLRFYLMLLVPLNTFYY